MSIIIIFICSIWIFFSIFKQIKPKYFTRNNDPFALIPIWTLFSPKPIKNNYLLGYRDLLEDGSITEITIVNDFVPKWYFTFWLGQRRDVKFILGIKKQLDKYKNHQHLFVFSNSFLLIKNYISQDLVAESHLIKKRQVIYFKRGGWQLSKKDEVLFVTNVK